MQLDGSCGLLLFLVLHAAVWAAEEGLGIFVSKRIIKLKSKFTIVYQAGMKERMPSSEINNCMYRRRKTFSLSYITKLAPIKSSPLAKWPKVSNLNSKLKELISNSLVHVLPWRPFDTRWRHAKPTTEIYVLWRKLFLNVVSFQQSR